MKNKLKRAAFSLFSQKGSSVSMAEIAEAVGIKKPSIYNHYVNKDDLLSMVIDEEVNRFFDTQLHALEKSKGEASEERLKKMFYSIMTYYNDYEKLRFWRQILVMDSDELQSKTREIIRLRETELYRNAFVILGDIIGIEEGQEVQMAYLQTLVALIQGTLDGILLYHQSFDKNIIINNVWQVYYNSIKTLKK